MIIKRSVPWQARLADLSRLAHVIARIRTCFDRVGCSFLGQMLH